MMKSGLFTGTFDPPTLGHLEIIQRAALLCDKLYVGIVETALKGKTAFDALERQVLMQTICADLKNVEVIIFTGLAVDTAKELEVDFIVRGLRNGGDFEFEYQMASANRQMTGIETLFLGASPKHMYLSSSLLRQIAANNHSLLGFVPDMIEQCIRDRLSGQFKNHHQKEN